MWAEEITGVVARTARLVAERYVYPELGDQLADLLGARSAARYYHRAASTAELADLVTTDLQSLNGDRHLRLKHHDDELPESVEDATGAEMARLVGTTMAGIARVERLAGNVGRLEISPSLLPPALAGDAMTAALRLLACTDALVLDLRGTVGGDPEMVTLVCGHFFDVPTHLTTMHERDPARFRQFWTSAYLPGARFGAVKPLYVLTSAVTFSGGESLGYDLQQLGRATVVGERTRGGAHPRIGFRAHPHLEVHVPVARPVNPVSGTNWEGTGVTPDVEVPADDAFDVAYRLARSALGLTAAAQGAD